MKVTCPVCGGRGVVPIYYEGNMAYLGPNGESWPMETCPGCYGRRVQET